MTVKLVKIRRTVAKIVDFMYRSGEQIYLPLQTKTAATTQVCHCGVKAAIDNM